MLFQWQGGGRGQQGRDDSRRGRVARKKSRECVPWAVWPGEKRQKRTIQESLGHPDRRRPSGRAGRTRGLKAAGVLEALAENPRVRKDEKSTFVKRGRFFFFLFFFFFLTSSSVSAFILKTLAVSCPSSAKMPADDNSDEPTANGRRPEWPRTDPT